MNVKRTPDFKNLAAVLEKKIPSRPTLFEFYLNDRLYKKYAGQYYKEKENDFFPEPESVIMAYQNIGYDYATIKGCDLAFKKQGKKTQASVSANDNIKIYDRKSFEEYPWPDAKAFDYSRLNRASDVLHKDAKLVVFGAGGVLESVIVLMGYENLCLALYDDPQLVQDVFEKVGQTYVDYYSIVAKYPTVGAIMANDDWGFNTQTMLSIDNLKNLVFPWHRQISEVAHKNGKYAILHSCGCYKDIIDLVINDLKYDARHSYEDNIIPVEKAYEELHGKIGILGGLDLDFMIRSDEKEIEERARKLVEKSMQWGGYALGTGNSVPEYVPDSHYEAMIRCALIE